MAGSENILIAEKAPALQFRVNTSVATSDESVEVLDGPCFYPRVPHLSSSMMTSPNDDLIEHPEPSVSTRSSRKRKRG